MKSILTSIKKPLGIVEEDIAFDQDILLHINTIFMVLTQLGVGPDKGFMIEDASSEWDDFLTNDDVSLEGVKTYVYLRVKLLFDPPSSSFVLDSMKRTIDELEWRLNTLSDNKT